MVDDIQTTGMLQSTNQINATQNQIQRRVPGGMMNLQHDVEKCKSGNNGGNKPLSRKGGKNKQGGSWNNKREFSAKASTKSGSKFDPEDKPFQKKTFQSAESLLNFHYTSLRSHHTSSSSNSHPSYRRRRTTTFNKEAFLQANCQFVVDYDVEKYSVHSADPDVLVDWNAIHLVYFPMHEEPNCPICLYPPTAAKMTRCGHVYCWACILHYLSLSDKSWNKCPICHEAVHEKDLKSVVPVVQHKFSRNGTIRMKLMRRPKNSLMAYNMDAEELVVEENYFSIWNGDTPLSKLTLATKDMMIDFLLNRERIELLAQLSEAKQEKSGEETFIEMAITKVETKIKAAQSHESLPNVESTHQEVSKPETLERGGSSLAKLLSSQVSKQRKLDAFSDNEDDEKEPINFIEEAPVENSKFDPSSESPESRPSGPISDQAQARSSDLERKARNSESSSTDGSMEGHSDLAHPKNNDYYYFYQAEDGQNIFINSLNARCLIEEYGSLENSPKKIIGQILDFESHTMTRELRKRYRYLSHLPVSCEFVICELMLRPPVLSKQTIHNFMGEFKKRRTARLKKLEEQRKHDMRANAEMSREAGFRVYNDYAEDVQIDLSDLTDFPSSLSPNEPLIAGAASSVASNNNYIEPFPTTIGLEGGDGMDDNSGPSFAQMLRVANQSPPSLKTCWGTASPSRVETGIYTRELRQSTAASRNGPIGDDEDGPDLVAPSLKEMFSAAMVMQSTSVAGSDERKSPSNKKGKKGKGGKGTLLFATGAQRKY